MADPLRDNIDLLRCQGVISEENGLTMDQFQEILMDRRVLGSTRAILKYIGLRPPIHERYILSAFMIVKYPQECLSLISELEEDMLRKGRRVMHTFEIICNKILRNSEHQPFLPNLETAYGEFHTIYQRWREVDTQRLNQVLSASYQQIVETNEYINSIIPDPTSEDRIQYNVGATRLQRQIGRYRGMLGPGGGSSGGRGRSRARENSTPGSRAISGAISGEASPGSRAISGEASSPKGAMGEGLPHMADVRVIAERAFWDILREDLCAEPPSYQRVFRLLEETRERLIGILLTPEMKADYTKITPRRCALINDINETIDVTFIQQQSDHDAFDPQQVVNIILFIIGKIQQLQSPDQDTATELWKQSIIELVKVDAKYSDVIPDVFKIVNQKLDLIEEQLRLLRERVEGASSQ